MAATETNSSGTSVKRAKGGGFLLQECEPRDVFTPEDLSDEQRQIAKTAEEFVTHEVMPAIQEIEAKNFAVTKGLLRKAGELGLTGVAVPERFGGMGMNKVTSVVVVDWISELASFSVAFGAHVGIGTLPLIWYGTEAQKQKYLPRLATGEWIASYALSESTSGSDALNCRTRAVLAEDGRHYVINGEKMWITNSGFADLFVLFAKSDEEKISAFLIERNTSGFSVGAEEHKLGIRGSSTCPLIFTDCRVPVENLLGEAGKGHHIALNALNIGRLNLGAACLGGARQVLRDAIQYAKERRAFGKSIAEFGLIQEKLAECAAGIYAAESIVYRTSGMIDAALADLDQEAQGAVREIQKRIEEYAVECSIVKVWVTDMLQRVADHDVQIHGGYGYVEEYPAERAYRDARINPIFEGTNEINRLIITGWLMKRAMKGELPLLAAIQHLMDEVVSPSLAPEGREGRLAAEHEMLAQAKKLGLYTAAVAAQKYMQNLAEQQEVMAAIADCVIEVYAMESCILRAEKLVAAKGEATASAALTMTGYYSAKAMQAVEASARKVVANVAEGDLLRTQMAIVRRLAMHEPADTIALGRQIAHHVLAVGRCSI
jgi:butyryl-CoA dehydrogenase